MQNINNNCPVPVILFENAGIIVVDKPAGIIVHGSFGDSKTFLEHIRSFLVQRDGSAAFLAPSNRLDRNTRGPVVFAKSREMAAELRRLFSQCQVQKIYLARVWGQVSEQLFVEADVIPGNHQRARVANLQCRCGYLPDRDDWFRYRISNSATISATVIRPIAFSGYQTDIEVYPWTGRYHQIRAICAALGVPIVGDVKYGREKKGVAAKNSRRNGNWMIQSLICKKLSIQSLGIEVISRFELGGFEKENLYVQE